MNSEKLKVHYDEREDILWLSKPRVEEEFRELGDWVNIELGVDDEPLGIENPGASKLLKDVAESLAVRAGKSQPIPD